MKIKIGEFDFFNKFSIQYSGMESLMFQIMLYVLNPVISVIVTVKEILKFG